MCEEWGNSDIQESPTIELDQDDTAPITELFFENGKAGDPEILVTDAGSGMSMWPSDSVEVCVHL